MAQGTIVVVCPGLVIWITPPQLHISLELLLSAGMLPMSTVGEPTTQGAAVTGTHGMGVSTPSAAAVAAATVGLDGDWHMPNGGMFTIGLLSMMLAAGVPVIVLLAGSTTSVLGATPNEHCIMAPMHTCCPIVSPLPGDLEHQLLPLRQLGGGGGEPPPPLVPHLQPPGRLAL